jgi:hypothetical protein
LGERLNGIQEVARSIRVSSTNKIRAFSYRERRRRPDRLRLSSVDYRANLKLQTGIAQPLSILIVIFAAAMAASLGKPMIGYCGFECAPVSVDRPYPIAQTREAAESAAATAADVGQARASR